MNVNELTLAEKSIIYTALQQFEVEAQRRANDLKFAAGQIPLIKPLEWLAEESRALRIKLFGEAPPQDMEPFNYYSKKM